MFLTEVTSQGLLAILNHRIVERVNTTYMQIPLDNLPQTYYVVLTPHKLITPHSLHHNVRIFSCCHPYEGHWRQTTISHIMSLTYQQLHALIHHIE